MRILVCGSRTFADSHPANTPIMEDMLEGLLAPGDTVVQGEAKGADAIAKRVATGHGQAVEGYPADWDKEGKSAGVIRNRKMLDEGNPDIVVAFVDKPLAESIGTNHMVTIARAAGILAIVVEVR